VWWTRRTSYPGSESAIACMWNWRTGPCRPASRSHDRALLYSRLGKFLDTMATREFRRPCGHHKGELAYLTNVVKLGKVSCRASASVARYGMATRMCVTAFVKTLAMLEKVSFPLSGACRDCRGCANRWSEAKKMSVHAFDRKNACDTAGQAAQPDTGHACAPCRGKLPGKV